MSINIDQLAAAVEEAGGEHAAAAALGVHVTTVTRWLTREATPPRTREPDLRRFMREYSGERERPLGAYSDRQLMQELNRRLSEKHESAEPGAKPGERA